MPQAYPLAWPGFRPRTPVDSRRRGEFTSAKKRIKIPEAAERLELEVERLGGTNLIISTNLRPTITGRPVANAGQPDDPGVAVYFQMGTDPITLACDTFTELSQNLAGLAGHIEATRRIDRYGVQKAKETLQAFAALPSPTSRTWRDKLGFRPDEAVTPDQLKARRRSLAARHHTDKGGSDGQMAEINAAYDAALVELGL